MTVDSRHAATAMKSHQVFRCRHGYVSGISDGEVAATQ